MRPSWATSQFAGAPPRRSALSDRGTPRGPPDPPAGSLRSAVLGRGDHGRGHGRAPGRQQPADRLADHLGQGPPGEPAGGRVGVQHAPVRVEHQHRVADRAEDLAAGHRPQVEQAELVDAPDQHRRGQHEGERGEVDLPERPHPQVEQEVEDNRQEDGPDQQQALDAVQPRHPAEGHHEQDGPGPDEGGVVGQVGPEQGAGLGRLSGGGGGLRRVEADQVVGGGPGQQEEHGQGLDGERRAGPPGPAAVPAALKDEGQVGRWQQDDADILEVAPGLAAGQVAGAELKGRADAPPDRPGKHGQQAGNAGRRPAPPDEDDGRGDRNRPGHQQPARRHHQHVRARGTVRRRF